MKNFLIILSFAIVLFSSSCQQKEELKVTNEITSLKDGVLYESEVVENLFAIGCTEQELPGEFEPAFSGYKSVRIFTEGDQIYEVYVFSDPESDEYKSAESDCTKKYFSDNGDCKESGNQCDVNLENGKIILICCE